MAENQVGAVRETAEQEGTAVARHARQAAGEVGGTAREQVGQVAQEAKGQAKHVVHDVRQRVAGEAEQQAQRVSQQINRIADELHSMAENSGPDSMTAPALRQVAESGRQAARFLDERGARGLLDSAQDFARRKPGTFLIGAAVAGFLVTRVAKSVSGSSGQEQGYRSEQGYLSDRTTPLPTTSQLPQEPEFSAPAPRTGVEAPGVGYPSGTGYPSGSGYPAETGSGQYPSGSPYQAGTTGRPDSPTQPGGAYDPEGSSYVQR
ncbi:hypothetical protein ACFV4N_24240 [Actinosynnema sp. NPDC059797]